ncbi:MAG: CHAT domain-containing protein [Saprospiraceae bacterium]
MKMALRFRYPNVLCCLIFLSFNTLLFSQEIATPDSMSSYVSKIKEVLNSAENIDQPSSMLGGFLNQFDTKKINTDQSSLHYLAYAFKGYEHSFNGKHEEALEEYNKAYTFLSESKPYDQLLGHHYFLRSRSLTVVGDDVRGLQSLNDAEEVFLHKKDLNFLKRIYFTESDYYLKKKNLKLSLKSLEKAVALYRKDKYAPADILVKKGIVLSQVGQYQKADEIFSLAKSKLSDKNTSLSAELKAALGQHLLRQNKPTEALALYDRALEELCPGIRKEKFAAFKNCNNPSEFISTLKLRGEILYQMSADDATAKDLKNIYNNYLTGIRYLQFSKGTSDKKLSDEVLKKEMDSFLEEGIAACYKLYSNTDDNTEHLEDALHFLSIKKHSIEESNVDISDFQLLADKEDKTLLNFFYGKTHLFAFLISEGEHQFLRIQKEPELDNDLLQLIDFHQLAFQSVADFQNFKTLSHKLYSILFKEINIGTNQVVIIPDGLLSHLSFESFVTNLESSVSYPVDYLLFHKEITYAYSLQHLQKAITTSPLKTRTVITFAPKDFKRHGLVPLKGTPGHIRFLEDKLQAKKWIDQEATVKNFESLIAQDEFNIISFLTHADSGKEPWFCFYDEKLPLSKLPPLKANIATLNACNTIVRNDSNHKTTLDLSNSLCKRGIPTSIAPLWSVQHPKTVMLLEFFYLNLASGMEKDEAMQEAKISYLKSCGNDAVAASPHFWAGMVLTGNTESLYSTSFLFPLIFVILFALMIFAWKRTQQEVG